jgi:hypothetical protein
MPRIAAMIGVVAWGVAASPANGATTTYTDSHGHSVDVVSTISNPSRNQLVVDVLFGLVHGSEMDGLTVELTTSDAEHNSECGGAAGCYIYGNSPATARLRGYDTGEHRSYEGDNSAYTSATVPSGIVAHEYGHHVAASRLNDGPLKGGGLVNGTKRWATHVGICPRVGAGRLGNNYATAPGEGFAESYRALHFPETLSSWVFDPRLRPDKAALELIRKDVLHPYTGPERVQGGAGRFGSGDGKQIEKLRTPLDGELIASMRTTGTLKAKRGSGKYVISASRP